MINIIFLVTTKSSDSDYFLTDMMFIREGYNEEYVNTAMSIAGIFTDRNLDADELEDAAGKAIIANRRKIAEEITRNGKKFYRYNIITSINHGLARQDKPLPSGIPIQLSFSRAISEKGLIQVVDSDNSGNAYSFAEKTIPLINPVLSCYFVESAKTDVLYSKAKMYDVNVDYLEASIRRELLMNNVAEHQFKLFEGKGTIIIYSYSYCF